MSSSQSEQNFTGALANAREDSAILAVWEGLDPNAVLVSGDSPLVMAVTFGFADLTRFLLSKGANINARTGPEQVAPIHAASSCGRADLVELLIAHGASVDVTNILQRTALHVACMFGYPDVASVLLTNGANANATDLQGVTPLFSTVSGTSFIPAEMVASTKAVNPKANVDFESVLKLLIHHDAEIDAKTPNGMTAFDIANHFGKTDLAERLKSRNRVNVLSVNLASEGQRKQLIEEIDRAVAIRRAGVAGTDIAADQGPARIYEYFCLTDKPDRQLWRELFRKVSTQRPWSGSRQDPLTSKLIEVAVQLDWKAELSFAKSSTRSLASDRGSQVANSRMQKDHYFSSAGQGAASNPIKKQGGFKFAAATLLVIGMASTVSQIMAVASLGEAVSWEFSNGGLVALVGAIYMWVKCRSWEFWKKWIWVWIGITVVLAFATINLMFQS